MVGHGVLAPACHHPTLATAFSQYKNNDCMGCMHCVKFVPFLLAYYHDDNSGESWVSVERLAAESLHTETEVIRILKALERKSVLQIIRDHICPHAACRCRTISRAHGVVLGEDRHAIVDPGAIVANPGRNRGRGRDEE